MSVQASAVVHCHVLPGFNDGPRSLTDSLLIVHELAQLGFRRVVAAPHVMRGYYAPTPEQIRIATNNVNQAIRAEGLPIIVEAAAEYYLDPGFRLRLATRGPLLHFSDGQLAHRLVLIESALFTSLADLMPVVTELQNQNYIPVLTHTEQYIQLQHNPEQARELRRAGVRLQITLTALLERNRTATQKLACWLLNEKLDDYRSLPGTQEPSFFEQFFHHFPAYLPGR